MCIRSYAYVGILASPLASSLGACNGRRTGLSALVQVTTNYAAQKREDNRANLMRESQSQRAEAQQMLKRECLRKRWPN